MYQGIIGVLVLIIIVGGAVMLGSRKEESVFLGVAATSTSIDDAAMSGKGAVNVSTEAVQQGGAAAKDQSSQANMVVAAGSDSVSVFDQPAGMTVAVQNVSISKPGWVAIKDGGWYLGAAKLSPGTHSNITVDLLRGTKTGSAYEAVLFYDNGNGTFDVHADTVITKADGSALSAAFLAK